MTKRTHIYLMLALTVLLLTNACSNQLNNGASDTVATPTPETVQANNGEVAAAPIVSPVTTEKPDTDTSVTKPQNETSKDDPAEADSGQEIIIEIDQSEQPTESNSFTFAVKQLPKGFSLGEMHWVSKENMIINSVQDAIEHGANGGDGFYISVNGQFCGFIYPDVMKGEKGKVVFWFTDEQGKDLKWTKEITLK